MLRLREEEKLRARDAATRLGVSEAEFVAAKVGHEAIRLQPDFADILRALSGVGEVLALTRNEHCVHEKHGTFEAVAIEGQTGSVRDGGGLELQLFLSRWHHAYKLTDEGEMGMIMTSLQFFDADGTAVHKVYLTENSDRDAFDAIVGRFMHAEQSNELDVTPDAPSPDTTPPAEGTHTRVAPGALRVALEKAAETGAPISVVVGNPGAIQIHTGPISKVMATGPWYNILDPRFNMHLHEAAVDGAWVVREPSADGVVTSLELIDATGRSIVQISGERSPGKPQSPAWRAIVDSLPLSHAA
ncbi:hemin-degrading factor [Rhodomicrobium udaipurense]|uniref:Hemin-degrading factor n=4 Tax=Rhodomicrobium udaipurense TaxID=1202716 RepID=A0A8I1KJ66_9HYPH|nr:hemin-degrading factor [Rhodomicrobium udaipurense]